MPKVIRSQYSTEKLDQIRRLIEVSDGDKPNCFSVLVDDIPVTRKTNNLEHFYDFENSIEPSTKTVCIRIHYGDSNNNDSYVLERKAEKAEKGTSGLGSLSDDGLGAIIEEKVSKQLAIERRELEFKNLTEKYEAQSRTNAKLKKQVETLEREKGELENSNSKFAALGRGAAIVADNFVFGSKALPNTGLGNIMNGLLGFTENIPVQEVPTGATYSPISEQPASDENQKVLDWMKSKFIYEEFEEIMQILTRLAEHKENIREVLSLLTVQQ